ncbi:Protein FIZZY-RELATED 2 [Dictyocoela muelleri]|nr:Protein FIZZY-RELATED 2 [Dictyocoela muelleri]
MERYFNLPKPIKKESPKKATSRSYKILTKPFRCIQLEGLADDFYSNVVDWHSNYIAYAIGNCLCLFDFNTSQSHTLYVFEGVMCTAVRFCNEVTIAVGCTDGQLYYLDINKMHIKIYKQHVCRIGVIDYFDGVIYTGGRDKNIKFVDVRFNRACVLGKHDQEVCGLKISKVGNYIASGGNDNNVFVYDKRYSSQLAKIVGHKAAVKALSWSPINSNLLCSGGGTADKCLKIWNLNGLVTKSNNVYGEKDLCLKSIDCGAQVCGLYWTGSNEIISTHGYAFNDIRVSKYPNMNMVRVYKGHRNRVVHFAVSCDERHFVTGSSDNLLCFWQMSEKTDEDLNIR